MKNPEDIIGLFAHAWADRDAQALAGLFAQDAEFVNVVGLWWHDREAIRVAHAYGFDVIFGDSTLNFVESRSRRIGDSAAVVHGKWKITGQVAADGSVAGERCGIFTFVCEKLPAGDWQVVAAQNTDIIHNAESIAVIDGQSVTSDYR
jgi:uncharacterized protein (TIGR02246 family)